MQIQNKLLDNKGVFYIAEAGRNLAELDYRLAPGLMIIDHTEVDESLQGKKVGYLLVKHAADHARENNLKIIPLCSFAKAIFEKRKDEFGDLLKART